MGNCVNKVFAIVVTYNRLNLLQLCIESLRAQTRALDGIIVIDNASTDGTEKLFQIDKFNSVSNLNYVRLAENVGGAGGFMHGMQHALSTDADWLWVMDDDAAPHSTALEELMLVAIDPHNIYGSAAINGDATSWAVTLSGPPPRTANKITEIPVQAQVQSLPFLGLMIHRNLIKTIGLPDAGYFIAADDIEYCIRASRAGAKIIIAGKSHIEHPRTERHTLRVLGAEVNYLRLAPWKRYYDTRNRMLIARKYYGIQLLTQTVPGSFVRLCVALYCEPHKFAQLWAFCTGMFDGLLGIKGRRHARWGIRQ
jgi:rhamnopyranosyl-N-acetylglucosaminyl-diphospho-decaprenol beta-1,3/1,4-galactofuranosyltransferase